MTSRGDSEIPRQEPEPAKGRSSFAAMLKEQFRQLARSIIAPREAPAPQPTKRRRRKEDTGHVAFRMAAKKVVRRTVRLPAAAYAAVSYLADALEWINHDLADMDEDMQPSEQHHLSLHL
jgi:hypothetical protein